MGHIIKVAKASGVRRVPLKFFSSRRASSASPPSIFVLPLALEKQNKDGGREWACFPSLKPPPGRRRQPADPPRPSSPLGRGRGKRESIPKLQTRRPHLPALFPQEKLYPPGRLSPSLSNTDIEQSPSLKTAQPHTGNNALFQPARRSFSILAYCLSLSPSPSLSLSCSLLFSLSL